MKATVLNQTGQALDDRPIPAASEGEVLVRVAYCGICGSDLHARAENGRHSVILGHEFSGVVEHLGSGAGGKWAVGDRVVINPNGGWCGECSRCTSGRVNQCHQVLTFSVGYGIDGGLAPLVAVPVWSLRRIPQNLSLQHAAWVEPLAVALRTLRRSTVERGDNVVVIGAGPVGLLLVGLLANTGANKLLVVEPGAAPRSAALARGATSAVDPLHEDVEAALTASGAPDVVFECSGAPGTFDTATQLVAAGGTVVLTGIPRSPASIDIRELVHREVTVTTSFIYTDEFDDAIQLLAGGTVEVDSLTTAVVDLEDVLESFAEMANSETALKILVSPQSDHQER